ncbi:hypothetical protein [Curtobacterium sp. MCBD17_003]|uniref:hypothetical protein n=1 Tax=Curtobacterium sp. MCBD17_003 TaxID=2175667 RepID=UPI000DAA71AF|nr:hypothetical protein [Curtobacterium sp. MCBD17_003]WIE54207.1 hypothetical protein DEI88_013945 [Curtobacterium sp. MCBD17_003]
MSTTDNKPQPDSSHFTPIVPKPPISTTPNTPLDAIKAAYLRVNEQTGMVLDRLLGAEGANEDAEEISYLDMLRYDLARLVCEQLGLDIPDRTWVPTRESVPQLFQYDNGDPVFSRVPIANGIHVHIWPRFDTEEAMQAMVAYAVRLAYRPKQEASPTA